MVQMIFLAKMLRCYLIYINLIYINVYIVTYRVATVIVSRLLIIRAIVLSKLATCCLLVIRLLSRQICSDSLRIYHIRYNKQRDLGYVVQYISVICSISVSMSMSHHDVSTREFRSAPEASTSCAHPARLQADR